MLETIERHIEKELVSDWALSRLREITDHLPTSFKNIEIECRLDESAPCVDLIIGVTATNGARELLSGREENELLSEAFSASKEWRNLRDLVRLWEDPDQMAQRWMSSLYMEFDADKSDKTIPIPSIFVVLDNPHRLVSTDSPVGSESDAALTIAKTLLAERFTQALASKIVMCFDQLSAESQMLYLGVMLGRDAQGVRFSAFAPMEEIIPYLKRIGWTHSLEEVTRLLSAYGPFEKGLLQFDFDIGQTVDPALRLSFTLDEPATRRAFLEKLLNEGLCAQAKGRVIASDTAHRKFSCFKLAAAVGKPITAKVYSEVV